MPVFSFIIEHRVNKKAGHTKGIILRQLGCLGLLRPVTFRPLLTEGLALSWSYLFVQVGVNEIFISILNAFQNVLVCGVKIHFKYSRGCWCCKGSRKLELDELPALL